MLELLMYLGVFVLIGGGFYLLDEKKGVSWYSAWWKFTSKDPLPEGKQLGFICGRRTRERVLPAACLAVLACVLIRFLGEHDFVTLMLKGAFLMFPGMLLGFALMGLVRKNPKFSPKVEAALSVIDKIEQGDVDLSGVAQSVANEAKDLGNKAARVVGLNQKSATTVKSAEIHVTPETSSAPKPKRDVQSALRDFTERR